MAIGYACLTIGMPDVTFSRCTLRNVNKEKLREITSSNLISLEKIIDYNIKMNIKLFRISSDVVPFGSHRVNNLNWQYEFEDDLKRIGRKIIESGMRVSMHPGQYTVLNSQDEKVVQNAIKDLKYHTDFLKSLGVDSTNKLVLHVGGVYGDKEKAIVAFIKNYVQLEQSIKDRLVLENDDKNYSIEDVLNISKSTGAPVIFDNLHNMLNPSKIDIPETEWIKMCGETWKDSDGKQKIHYSQQRKDANAGAHSGTIRINEFLEFYQNLKSHSIDKKIDIMLEVKDKNLSAIKCINCTNENVPIREIEEEWAIYKYLILSRSSATYNEIREMLKSKDTSVLKDFYFKIESAINLPQNIGAEINAAEHVWGYVNKLCSNAQRNRYHKLLGEFKDDKCSIKSLKNHIFKCAIEQNVEYLMNSYYFYNV